LRDEERDQLYARSRLLFLSSKQQGFGLAGVEAAAAGMPVMGLAGTVMSELFPNGSAVLVNDLLASTTSKAAVGVLGDSACRNRRWGSPAANVWKKIFWKNTSSRASRRP